MLRVILAGLRARPLRLLMSAVAICLGVAFVAASLILSDSADARLRTAIAFETRGVDASISAIGGSSALDDALLARVRQVPGVAAAEGRSTVSTPLRGGDGRPTDTVALALPTDAQLRPFDLASGRFPRTAGEIAMEHSRAHAPGRTVTLLEQDGEPRSFTLVGTFRRPTDSGIGSASLVLLPQDVRRFAPGQPYGEIVVRATSDTEQQQIADTLTRAVGKNGVTVVTGQEAAARLLSSTAPSGAQTATFLTAFAVLAMVVAAMVITNSFSILITQRAREAALLRCIGARRRQVFAGVLGEAAVVGAVASAAGLVVGLGMAAALQTLPTGEESAVHVPLTTRTIVMALVLGVLTTLAAAVLPARAATRTPPVEALRSPQQRMATTAMRYRSAATVLLLAVAVTSAAYAMRAAPQDGAALSVMAMVALLGATLVAGPLLVGPFVRVLGEACTPLLGQPARMAALNAAQHPRRTAASAAALTVGLAVVSLATTVTAGVEAGRTHGLEDQVAADFTVTSVVSHRPLPAALPATLTALPGVASVAQRQSFSGDLGKYGLHGMAAVRGDAVGTLLRPVVLSGRLDQLRPGELAVSDQLAKETGLGTGDTVRAGSPHHPVTLRVVAVYDAVAAPGADLGLALVDLTQLSALAAEGSTIHDPSLLIGLTAHADPQEIRPRLEKALATAPLARLDSSADVKEQMTAPLRSTLDLLWALTALSVLIAFAGIANTLSLSVLERTRESALLRTLGLTRNGLRATLVTESILIALLGSVCGLLVGIGAAWLLAEVASTDAEPVLFTLPWGRLGTLLAAALLAAPLAALAPARRSARTSLTEGMGEA
ncbi:FtsX-like permease family protein [Streptomyces finlayi]|uniref:FtsX-like permease family protein n=1 Tax=Streptomyces finlayi TaxID=67296 RepID=A0A7G7BN28_9ACTN|nr:ABC transporter permease [Streptomyces finlayi]QNE76743.1 FtsX-like permease family protein [Streptomyces finlayi]